MHERRTHLQEQRVTAFCKLALLAAILWCIAASDVAHACAKAGKFVPSEVKYSDLVVVGRITGYERVLDQEARRRMAALSQSSPQLQTALTAVSRFQTDYTRFHIGVDQVLYGSAPATLNVTSDSGGLIRLEGLPKGQYLIALRKPAVRHAPLRGPNALLLATPEPDKPTILQDMCSPPFFLPADGKDAQAVRAYIVTKKDR